MTTTTFAAERYKAAQRTDWDAAAQGWRTWGENLEAAFGPVGRRLIELAGIRAGYAVLDVATGVGEPALTAAGLVGSSGTLVATDLAPGMIGIARDRAAARGLANVAFYERDAEELDLPERSFDAVLCRFGLMFLPDVDRALASCYRVLVPGGRIAASVWGPPDGVPMSAATFGAVARTLQLPPPPPGSPGVFALADAAALQGRFEAAGFTGVRSETSRVEMEFRSVEEMVAYLTDVAAPIHNLLKHEPPERRQAVWAAIADANRQFVGDDGRVHLWGDAFLLSGSR